MADPNNYDARIQAIDRILASSQRQPVQPIPAVTPATGRLGAEVATATTTLSELRQKRRQQMLMQGFTPEAVEEAVKLEFPEPAYVGGYSGLTRPYATVPLGPPTNVEKGGLTVTEALKPQTRELDILGAFAPGAGATATQVQEAKADVEKRRGELRQRLKEGGRGAVAELIPRGGFGIPAELAQQPLSEQEIEKIVQSQYPTGGEVGQAVESPLSWATRVFPIVAVENAIAGAIGYALTPGDIQRKKEAARTGALAGTTGIKGEIVANIADTGGGGFMKELGELAQYSDYPSLTPYATGAGLALDLFGTGGLGGVKAGVKGTIRLAEGVKAGEKIADTAKAGAKVLGAELARTIPIAGEKIGQRIQPNDIRTVQGAVVARELEAAERYRSTYDRAAKTEANELVDGALTGREGEQLAKAFEEIEKLTANDEFIRLLDEGDTDASIAWENAMNKAFEDSVGIIKGKDEMSQVTKDVITSKLEEVLADPTAGWTTDRLLSEVMDNPNLVRYGNRIRMIPRAPDDVAALAHKIAIEDVEKKFANSQFVDAARKRGPQIYDDVDNAIVGIDDVSRKIYNDAFSAARKIDSGETLTKAEKIAVRRFLAPAVRTSPELSSKLTEAFSKQDITLQKLPIDDFFKQVSSNTELASELSDSIRKIVSFDAGVSVIDNRLKNIPGIGDTLIHVTRNTIATPEAAERIRQQFFNTSPLSAVLKRLDVEKGKLTTKGDVTLFRVNESDIDTLKDAVTRARVKGDITPQEATEIFSELDKTSGMIEFGGPRYNAKIKSKFLDKIVTSEVDDIAKNMQKGITGRQLAPVVEPSGRVIPYESERLLTGQERRFEELSGDIPVFLNRTVKASVKRVEDVSTAATERQQAIMQRARNAIGTLDKRFRNEWKEFNADVAIQLEYGVPVSDAVLGGISKQPLSDNTKIFLLGRGKGRIGRTDSGPGFTDKLAHAKEVIRSMLFARSSGDFSLSTLWNPSYRYGENALYGTEAGREIKKLEYRLARITNVDEIDEELNLLTIQLQALVKKYPDLLILAGGGKQFAIATDEKQIRQSLIAAYAFSKSNEIAVEAITSASRNIPGLFDEQRQIYKAILPPELGNNVDQVLYHVISKEILSEQLQQQGALAMANGFTGTLPRNQKVESWLGKVRISKNKNDIPNEYLPDAPAPELQPLIDVIYSTFGSSQKPSEIKAMNFVAGLVGTQNGWDTVSAMNNALDLVRVSGNYYNNNLELTLQSINILKKQDVEFGKFISPPLIQQYMDEIGRAPKVRELEQELAKLSDLAVNGNKSAIFANKVIRQVLDSYNSLFYYSILSVNPIFHGRNILTAPFIIPYTTGQSLFKANTLPSLKQSVRVLLDGRPGASPYKKDAVLFTDKFGIPYTSGKIYDLALNSGIFRSQLGAEVDRKFTADIGRVVSESNLSSLRRKTFTAPSYYLGTPLAEFSDSVFRLTTVINAMKEGQPVERALDLGRRSLFDYGDIGDNERKYVARYGFIFYNYFRQSVTTFVKNLMTNPERIVKQLRLVKGLTNLAIGDQNASDLAFYYPEEFGTTKIVATQSQSWQKQTGEIATLPEMPVGDGINLITQFLISPYNFFTGPELVGGGTAYEEGFPYSRMGPFAQSLLQLRLSKKEWSDLVKLQSNRIPPQHMALYSSVPLVKQTVVSTFNVQEIDAPQGERGVDGKVFFVEDRDFDRYKSFIATLQVTGLSRPFNEWSNNLGLTTGAMTAAQEETILRKLLARVGAVSYTRPAAEEERAMQLLKGQTKEMEEDIRSIKETMRPGEKR